jgi:hypothetical protein
MLRCTRAGRKRDVNAAAHRVQRNDIFSFLMSKLFCPSRLRRVLAVTAVWAIVVALAVPSFGSPRRELVEAVWYWVWLVGFAWSATIARLVAAAPRAASSVLLILLTVWLYVQLVDDYTGFFPVASWGMYGESRRAAPVTSIALRGTLCSGELVPLSVEDLHVGGFVFINSLYGAIRTRKTARDSAAAEARLDQVLRAVAPKTMPRTNLPLCTLTIMYYEVPASRVGILPLPPPRAVRDVALR